MNGEALWAIGLVIATCTASLVGYHFLRKVARATREYDEAGAIVKNVVLTFNRRQEEQDKRIGETTYRLEGVESRSARVSEQLNTQLGKINYATSSLKDLWTSLKQVAGHVQTTSERVNTVEKTQKELQRQVSDLNVRYTGILPEREAQVSPGTELEKTFESLTETEREVIRTLASQGPKSATELSKVTRRTREHTARTMKKLFQLGYVNRETHKLPYRYTLNDKAYKVVQEAKKQETQAQATA